MMKRFISLTPLVVFLALYLLLSILSGDFYKVPVSAVFVIACIYAFLITPGTVKEKITVFSKGAADSNVLLMLWIFILAGAFASEAKAIGSVDATVNLTLKLLPGKFLLVGLFLASCFISISIGTSVGTIVAVVPVAAGIASQTGISLPMITAAIVGGSFFGDNLSFISDTTIAATTTQGCAMTDKFKANFKIVLPAAILVALIYIFLGQGIRTMAVVQEAGILELIPYLAVIALVLFGINVLFVLTIGLALCTIIGIIRGFSFVALVGSMGEGIGGMGDLICVTLLAAGLLEIIRFNGGIDYIVDLFSRKISGRRGAKASIAAIVSLSNFCTANNTIAILSAGRIAKDISSRFNVSPKESASILDTFSCIVQGIIPYGAQLLMASSLAGIAVTHIIPWLFYPMALFLSASAFMIFGRKQNSSEQSNSLNNNLL